MNDTVVTRLQGGLVISCQAVPPNPLAGAGPMALMAAAAEQGGAVGIRANGADDIAAIKAATPLPVIGINKVGRDSHPVYITPTFESAAEIARAGCDLVALDGTPRPRPDAGSLADLVRRIHDELGLPVMADVDCLESGRYAQAAGADVVATTLSGYTESHSDSSNADIALVRMLASELAKPIIAEGRYWTTDDVAAAFAAGAHAVVVGTAVTNPMAITRRLARGARRATV